MVDQEKLRPGFHYTPHGVYVHGLGVSRMSTVEFDGPAAADHPAPGQQSLADDEEPALQR